MSFLFFERAGGGGDGEDAGDGDDDDGAGVGDDDGASVGNRDGAGVPLSSLSLKWKSESSVAQNTISKI